MWQSATMLSANGRTGGLICCRAFSSSSCVSAVAGKPSSLLDRLKEKEKALSGKKSEKPFYPAKPLSKIEPKKYRTLLVRADGSSLTIRHIEPRPIITLPVDISTMTEKERLLLIRGQQANIIYSKLDKTIDKERYTELVNKKPSFRVSILGRRINSTVKPTAPDEPQET